MTEKKKRVTLCEGGKNVIYLMRTKERMEKSAARHKNTEQYGKKEYSFTASEKNIR